MDAALRPGCWCAQDDVRNVSILVLMDAALRRDVLEGIV